MKDTMVEAIALSSPSGKMSKRSRDVCIERLRIELFGKDGIKNPECSQPPRWEVLMRQAKQLRDLALRGMNVRSYLKKANQLEQQAIKEKDNE